MKRFPKRVLSYLVFVNRDAVFPDDYQIHTDSLHVHFDFEDRLIPGDVIHILDLMTRELRAFVVEDEKERRVTL